MVPAPDRAKHAPLQDVEAFRTYVRRLARLLLLRQFCQSDHPVLRIEEDLAEMARSKLEEQILLRIPATRVRKLRPALEHMIKRATAERILAADEDDYVKEDALEDLEEESLDALFPQEARADSGTPAAAAAHA